MKNCPKQNWDWTVVDFYRTICLFAIGEKGAYKSTPWKICNHRWRQWQTDLYIMPNVLCKHIYCSSSYRGCPYPITSIWVPILWEEFQNAKPKIGSYQKNTFGRFTSNYSAQDSIWFKLLNNISKQTDFSIHHFILRKTLKKNCLRFRFGNKL